MVIHEIGLLSTITRSQSGMVAGSTMMLVANTSGKRKLNPTVITVIGVRMTSPSTMKIHPMPNPSATSSANAAITPGTPASGR